MESGLEKIITNSGLNFSTSPYGTDKHGSHDYIVQIYNHIHAIVPDLKLIVEIGVRWGASLALWHLAFPHAKVVGYDIHEQILHPIAEGLSRENKIQIIIQDAYQSMLRQDFYQAIDLLIDDGPHTLESQQITIQQIDALSPSGTLVIEDIYGGRKSVNKLIRMVPREKRPNLVYFSTFHKSGYFNDTVLCYSNNSKVVQQLRNVALENEFWGFRSHFFWQLFLLYRRINLFFGLDFHTRYQK
jgi:hypothetical protein